MSDWRPEIVTIDKVEKHPDADALDVATVLGDYPVVVKRNEYSVGDIAAYLPIDTIVPDTEQFYFLCPKDSSTLLPKYALGSVPEKHRTIKAKRLRGIYSQGMLYKVHSNMIPGDSVVELLGLKKLEEEEEDNIPRATKSIGANAEKAPSGWSIPYYDIEGLRKFSTYIKEDEEVVVNEKLHGCVAYDTLISTLELGDIKIGELVKNKAQVHVKCLNIESNEIEYRKCEDYFNNGPSEDWYEIESEDGNILKITGNHLVWMPSLSCYRSVSELAEADKILID
jgi:hypothetical protein